MQEVESHHDEGVQGNERYVHLKQESRADAIVVRTFQPHRLWGWGRSEPPILEHSVRLRADQKRAREASADWPTSPTSPAQGLRSAAIHRECME